MRFERHLSAVTIALLVLLAQAPAGLAGEISGKVVLSGKPAADVVVSLEGLRVEDAAGSIVSVLDHRNLSFVPHVLVVRAGSTVQFKNSDGMPCRIYSISLAGVFVLGQQNRKAMTITFDRPGVIEVRCADHRRMYAYIIVRENPFYATTNRRGRYKLSGVPPGRYTLQAWYEGTIVDSRAIEVTGRHLKADFKADRPQPQLQNLFSATPLAASPEQRPSERTNSWRMEP